MAGWTELLNRAEKRNTAGHLAALVTVLIWGTTYISSKILLQVFRPVELLFFRFVIGFLVLTAVKPCRLRISDKRQELLFALAGLCGVCLYSLLENIALTLTMASNVGVIISAAPFFTAILIRFLAKRKEKLQINFLVGFVVAMFGIGFISFNGASMELNPVGDLLAVFAAFVWGCYSVLTKKISGYGYHTVQITRRIFGYGILFIVPVLLFMDFRLGLERFTEPVYLLNLLFLGMAASALCFVTWNYAVKELGQSRPVYIFIWNQ